MTSPNTRLRAEDTHQLIVSDLGTTTVEHEPPRSRTNCGKPHVYTNGHIPEEEPSRDEGVFDGAWRFSHDVQVGRVEAESSGWEAIGHQVHPEQLDWDQSLRQTKGRRHEDAVEGEEQK